MKKLFNGLIVCVILFVVIILEVSGINNEVFLVTTNPGEDMETMINISWHSKFKDLEVEFTKSSDLSFSSKETKKGECFTIPFDAKGDVFQCKVTLDNLTANTEYIYRVGNSNTFTFRTAGGDSFSFLHLSDIHSYEKIPSRVDTASNVINKAYKEFSNMAFSIFTGDVTAYGTVYEQWEQLFKMNSAKLGAIAITPGNHDYYNTSATITNIGYFNAVTNNPNNGAEGLKNSTYYFIYNNVLFISLNSEASAASSAHLKAQKDWFIEVVENNPTEFIVCYTHRPFYTGDSRNAGQAADSRKWWQGLFDQYGVDLVLTGHNHVYARTHQIYNNEIVTGKGEGTVYITATQLGDRAQTEPGNPMSQVEYSKIGKIDGGAVFSVSKGKIEIKLISTSTSDFNDDYTIYSKTTNINTNAYLNSFEVSHTTGSPEAKVSFTNPGRSKFTYIRIYNNDTLIKDFSNLTTNSFILDKLLTNQDPNNIRVETRFRNGEIVNKNLLIENKIYDVSVNTNTSEYNISWNTSYNESEINNIALYINNQNIGSVKFPTNSIAIPHLATGESSYELRFIDKEGDVVDTFTFTYVNDKASTKIYNVNVKKEDKKLQLSWDTYFLAEEVDNISVYVNNNLFNSVPFNSSNLTLDNLIDGDNTIEIRFLDKNGNIVDYYNLNFNYNHEEDSEETNTPVDKNKPKTGLYIMIGSFFMITIVGATFLFRRRLK